MAASKRPAKADAKLELVKTSLSLPPALWERARIFSLKSRVPAQQIVAEALEDYLKKRGA